MSYLDTAKPLQQFSVTLGQCVDKDQTTSPNLLVRTSSYGDSVTAGQAFDLSLGLYATDGNENLPMIGYFLVALLLITFIPAISLALI